MDTDIIAARKLMSLIGEAHYEVGLEEGDLEKSLAMERHTKDNLRSCGTLGGCGIS